MLIGNVAVHLSRKYKIPLVYTYHTRYEEYLHYIKLFSEESGQEAIKGHILRQGKKMLPYYMANYMKRCDMVIAPSRGMADYLRGQKIKTPVRVLPVSYTHLTADTDGRVRHCDDDELWIRSLPFYLEPIPRGHLCSDGIRG